MDEQTKSFDSNEMDNVSKTIQYRFCPTSFNEQKQNKNAAHTRILTFSWI